MTNAFIRTLREDPADAEVASHKLLVRAGYIRRAAPGIYTWLPLGLRTLRKVEQVVREEMDTIAQEVHFPALLSADPYKATDRWEEYGPTLFKLRDRKGGDYMLAPTHEEMFTLLVKDMYSSYKDLPVSLYQIQTKYRDEARPRAGLIRGREFIMKDSYSFDIDDAGLERSYQLHRAVYQRIFERLGLEYVIVNAMSGAMGGSHSEEFLHPSPIGEDTFVRSAGGYAANAEAVTTPVPEAVVEAQISQHLAAEGKEGDEEHAKEIRPDAEKAVVEQLLLDVLAEKLDVAVTQDELFDFLLQTAQQYGMEPGQFLQGAQQAGQIPAFAQEIARNKSLAVALREVTVKDSEGNVVDLSEFIGTNDENEAAAAEDAEDAPAEDAE